MDIEQPELAERIRELVQRIVPRNNAEKLVQRVRENSSKFLIPFLCAGPLKKRIIRCGTPGNIEMLADGQQWLAAGTHSSGSLYEWQPSLPSSFPTLTPAEVDALWEQLNATFASRDDSPGHSHVTPATSHERDITLLTEVSESDLTELRDALAFKPLLDSAEDNDVWSMVGYALLSLGEQGRELWREFSQAAPNYQPGADDEWWDQHSTQVPRTDFTSILAMASKLGWRTARITPSSFSVDEGAASVEPAASTAVEKPIIRLKSGCLDKYAHRAEMLMRAELFVQAGRLVRTSDAGERGVNRVSNEYLRRRLNALAEIQIYSKQAKEWVAVDCPKTFAANIVEQGSWPHLNQLKALVYAPFLRDDGSICASPGYDTSTQVLYIPSATFPPIKENPSKLDAQAALEQLLAPFAEFPFASDAMRSSFVAHILTECVRTSLVTAPMFWYTAPTASTGKTLLSKMASIIAHGVVPTLQPWSGDENELRKTIFSCLLGGNRSLGFDNIPNGAKIRSAVLCAALTSGENYTDRKLGVSESPTVRNKATMYASGNNITPVGDMSRRSIVIRLDAGLSKHALRERSFSIANLEGYVKTHRPALLVHALTIVRAYLMLQSSIGLSPLPSFEQWSEFVRSPIVWLGLEDPVNSQSQEADDDSGNDAAVFRALAKMMGGRLFFARELVIFDDHIVELLKQDGCHDLSKIGYWLRDKRDVIAGGFRLERAKLYDGVQRWRFVRVDEWSDLL